MNKLKLITAHYICMADFDGVTAPHGDGGSFDTAVDDFIEAQEGGRAASVFRIDPAIQGSAPMAPDVTDDAIARIRDICRQRREELPEWMIELEAA